MKPYGIRYVGPCCAWGCCWKQNCHSGFNRRLGHGPLRKKTARQAARREIRRAMQERAA